MKNNTNTFLNKPLPRFLGIFVLIASIATIFWLSRNVVMFDTKAALGNTPKDIEKSNITDTSFTVSYLTDEPVNGTLSYGASTEMSQVGFDVRDSTGPNPYRVHFVTVSNLSPNTKYYFSIASGDEIFQNGTAPFEVTTAPSARNQNPDTDHSYVVKGQVLLDEETGSDQAVVHIKTENSQTLSALVSKDGKFEINLSRILTDDLKNMAPLSPDSKLEMKAKDSKHSSTASFLLKNADPLPPISLSQNYDFTSNFGASATATESAQTTPFPIPSDAVDSIPAITTPKNDEEFKDQQPLFRGTAAPESDVGISIGSATATVQADENGTWEYRPESKIDPGEHVITVNALNAAGTLQTLTRSFTVFAEGSQFVEPSISPTPSQSATPTQSPTPTKTDPTPTVPAVSPTATAAPTIAPTVTPTISPTVVVVLPTSSLTSSPSPTTQITVPPIPDVGSPALAVGIVGVILAIGIGGLLFLLL